MASKVIIYCFFLAVFFIQSAAACSSCDTNKAAKALVMTHQQSSAKCSVNPLKLEACVDLLHVLLHLGFGHHSRASHCCLLVMVKGLVGLEAAVCLCNAVKADVLGVMVDLDTKLNLLANACGQKIPEGYLCQ